MILSVVNRLHNSMHELRNVPKETVEKTETAIVEASLEPNHKVWARRRNLSLMQSVKPKIILHWVGAWLNGIYLLSNLFIAPCWIYNAFPHPFYIKPPPKIISPFHKEDETKSNEQRVKDSMAAVRKTIAQEDRWILKTRTEGGKERLVFAKAEENLNVRLETTTETMAFCHHCTRTMPLQ